MRRKFRSRSDADGYPYPTPREIRLRRRRAISCRAEHWSALMGGRTLTPFRRPVNMDLKIAYIVTRCPRCRTNVQVPIALAADEELACSGPLALHALVERKLLEADEVFARMVLPRAWFRKWFRTGRMHACVFRMGAKSALPA